MKRKTLYTYTLRSIFFMLYFLLAGGLSFTQEAGYRIEEGGRFVQTLRWSEEENALYYEVEIQRREGAVWTDAVLDKTEQAFFEISLRPGNYRYRVRVYDFLQRPAGAAEWIEFEVYAAKDPKISWFRPEAFYLDEDISWVVNLSGKNLTGEIEIYLENKDSRGKFIRPERMTVERTEEGARLVFSYEQLEVGDYLIHAINPGGLKTELGTFRITFRKPVDINISAGYKPLVPLYGKTNELFGTNLFPLGAYTRFNLIPLKRQWGYLGFELEPAWNYLYAEGDTYTAQAHMTGGAMYGVCQLWFDNRITTLNIRLGGGLYAVLDYHFTYSRGKTEPMTVLLPALAGGLSFQWLIGKPDISFFVEAGADFTHMFAAENPEPGYLRPFMGVGWQF